MLGVILDEKILVDQALNNGVIDKKPMITLGLLIKHYYITGMNRDQIKIQIVEFMEKNYKDFSITKWYDKISKAVDKFFRDVSRYKVNVKLTQIKSIEITQGELDSINSLEDLTLEKLAFIMLIYAKISNIVMNNKEGWINQTCSMICKEAKVNLKGVEKERIFNNLYNNKYIGNNKTKIKVNYLDYDSEVAMVIDDFNEVIYQYLIWKGGKYKKCECCGKYIKMKSNKTKYCKVCKKEIKNNQNRENMQKYRNVVK